METTLSLLFDQTRPINAAEAKERSVVSNVLLQDKSCEKWLSQIVERFVDDSHKKVVYWKENRSRSEEECLRVQILRNHNLDTIKRPRPANSFPFRTRFTQPSLFLSGPPGPLRSHHHPRIHPVEFTVPLSQTTPRTHLPTSPYRQHWRKVLSYGGRFVRISGAGDCGMGNIDRECM